MLEMLVGVQFQGFRCLAIAQYIKLQLKAYKSSVNLRLPFTLVICIPLE